MKIRIGFLSLLATVSAFSAWSQTAEYDDMYFNAKDRVRVTASKPLSMYSAPMENNQVVTPINPTDSYSARNVNPEYIAQSKITTSDSEESVPYFISNYAPTGVNQNISNYNNSYPYNYYNNYYGGAGYYGSPYNSPYYSGMYSMYSPYNSFYPYSGFSPYGFGMSPYSGWSTMMSIGFGYGSGMWGNPYMGMGMGYGCMTCYNSFYGGYGMTSPWFYGNGFYPASVVVVNSDNVRPVTYGKRPSRSSDLNNVVYNNNRDAGTTTTAVLDSNGKVRGAGGRTSGNEPGSYYQRGWRENPATRPSSAWSDGGSGSRSGSNSSWYNSGSRSGSSSDSFFNSGSRSSGWSSGSSSGFSSGGGSRSSGGMSGGGSSGGRRGRD